MVQQEASQAQSMAMCADVEYFEAERIILLAGKVASWWLVLWITLLISDHIMHCAGERYFTYISEAQQMVSEFGQTVATLKTEEEMDSILPCSATIYLTSNNSIYRISSKNSALLIIRHPLPND